MARLTASEFADKLITRTRQAQADYAKGVQRVTENPAAAGVRAAPKWQTKVSSAEARDKYARNLGKVTLADWQNAAANLGASRLAQGIEAARPKIEAVAGPLLSHIEQGQNIVKNMPSTTLEDNLQRSAAFIRHMSKFGAK